MTDLQNNWGWTHERRQKQAENCRKTKPWQQSTGPKTTEGKEAVKTNAIKHGFFTPEGQSLHRTIKAQGKVLKGF